MSPVVTRATPRHEVRRDIQGLRAVAVALVVGFHLWPDAVPGGFIGVDVFLVVSGYLITRSLLASPPRTPHDLASFWARRIRRLLPAAILVLTVTLIATRLLAPETQWLRTAKESIASALYAENWMLVATATDYLTPGSPPTPVRHFWSLAVEEQFYLVWPILILLTALLVRGMRRTAVLAARFTIGVVLVISFAYGVAATAQEGSTAFFMTPTRVWELAAGGMVATWSPAVRLPRVRTLVAWLSLGVAVASAWIFTTGTAWPGWQAAVPVVATALFLRANAHDRWSPVAVLGVRPVQWLGDASYSVYLWHWPLLVLTPYVLERPLTWTDRLGVLAATLVLAGLTTRYVETPWRRPRRGALLRRPFQAAAGGMALVSLVAAAQIYGLHVAEEDIASSQVVGTGTCFGAAARHAGATACPVEPDADVVPPVSTAMTDKPAPFLDGCLDSPPFADAHPCTYGDGPVRIALVGNSHAAQWLPALQEMRDDVTVTTFLVTACSTVDAPLDWKPQELADGCAAWRDRTMEATRGERFDLVITSQRSVHPIVGYSAADTFEPWKDGFASYLSRWVDAGTNVLVVRDTPLPETTIASIPDCVADHPTHQRECSGARSDWLPEDPLVQAADELGVGVVDLSDLFCGLERCDGVNGGVVTYFDGSHLTRTYARTLAPLLEPSVTEALER